MDEIRKSLITLELGHLTGLVKRDVIEKARIFKYIRREGTPGHYRYIYNEDEIKFEVGDVIVSNETGLNIAKYSDKAVLIAGNTYGNIDLLRKVKSELGIGNWNANLKGWVFPFRYIDKILSMIISDIDDPIKKNALVNIKNASLSVGDPVSIKDMEGVVDKNTSDNNGVKYDVKLPNGEVLPNVDERFIKSNLESNDSEISEHINKTSPENRGKMIKKLYGIKPIADLYNYTFKELLEMHGLSEGDLLPKKTYNKKSESGRNQSITSSTKDPKQSQEGLTKQQLISKLREMHRKSLQEAIEKGLELKDSVLSEYDDIRQLYIKKRQAMSEETKRKIAEALTKKPSAVENMPVNEFVQSITKETMDDIINSFKETISKEVESQKNKLADLIESRTSLYKEQMDLYRGSRESDDYNKKTEYSDKARKISPQLKKLDNNIRAQQNVIRALTNGGELSTFKDKVGSDHKDIPDFTKVNTIDISYDIDNILSKEKPPYIPDIDEDQFKSKGYILDAIRIDRDTYMVATNGHTEQGAFLGYNPKTNKNEYEGYDSSQMGYVILTLDQLVLTNDYYITKQKAKFKEDADNKNKRAEEYWDKLPLSDKEKYLNQKGMYASLPVNVRKKVTEEEWNAMSIAEKEKWHKPFKKYGAERLKTVLEEGHMWTSFHNMYERFVNPSAVRTDRYHKPLKLGEFSPGSYGNEEVFASWNTFSDMLNWKLKDIKIQREIESDMRKAALETSFGESNTKDVLKGEYGIMVKRQNGDNITPAEVNQIKLAWESVQSSFGKLMNMSREDGLKISHSGDKYIFASKAVGMYIPSMKTIAVSAKHGDDDFGFTLSHEIAHWIDHTLGSKLGKRHASDNYESIAGQIASEFRKNMNKQSESQYINNTAECFARAMEQYHAIESKGESAELAKSGRYFAAENYVNKERYTHKIKPLIEKFLEENKELLKSILNQ